MPDDVTAPPASEIADQYDQLTDDRDKKRTADRLARDLERQTRRAESDARRNQRQNPAPPSP